eukprot:4712407-Pleurochrysis_carterae.AAC.1
MFGTQIRACSCSYAYFLICNSDANLYTLIYAHRDGIVALHPPDFAQMATACPRTADGAFKSLSCFKVAYCSGRYAASTRCVSGFAKLKADGSVH